MTEIGNWTIDIVDNFDWTELHRINEFANIDDIDGHGLFCAKFRGSLFALFGKPAVDTKDLEDGVYEYRIKCEDKSTGQTRFFNITELRLGPVLSAADNSMESKSLGQSLWDKILATKPADYKAKYFDDENAMKVYYGCKNVLPFFDLRSFNILDYVRRFSRMIVP